MYLNRTLGLSIEKQAITLFAVILLLCSAQMVGHCVSSTMTVDGEKFFPIGWYTANPSGSTQSAHDYLATQRAQGMNTVFACYGLVNQSGFDMPYIYMDYEIQGAAQLGMKVVAEAKRDLHNYPYAIDSQQINHLKGYSNLIGWYIADEPRDWQANILPNDYSYLKSYDPNHDAFVVHTALSNDNGTRPAQYFLENNPNYTDIVMMDWYYILESSSEFGMPMYSTTAKDKENVGLVQQYGKTAYMQVPQASAASGTFRFPTFAEERYLCYAPISVGARGLFFYMYENTDGPNLNDPYAQYTTSANNNNVIAPIAREIRALSPAILSDSPEIEVTSNRDYDSNSHGVNDVTYLFGEDARGGYVIAVNNTGSTISSVTLQFCGDILAGLPSSSMQIPVMFENRNVTLSTTQYGARVRTLTDSFGPYDVNVYRIYDSGNVVSIDLGSLAVEGDGITHPQNSDGNTVVVNNENNNGANCRRNEATSGGSPDPYFYFAVSDSFAYQGSSPDLNITVEYYDTGSGSLELQYDSATSAYTSGGSVTLTGSNTWKSYTFHVADAYFGNRQTGGADFRIYRGTGSTFYLDTVQVSKNTPPISSASPVGGTYNTARVVTLSVNKPATIYYTTNGSEPTTSSTVYTAPITISSTTTLRFFSVDTDGIAEASKKQESYTIVSTPDLADWITVADSTADWSWCQGYRGWSYKFSTDPTFSYSDMTWDSSGYWKCSEWGGQPAIYQTHSVTQGGGTIIGFRQWHNASYTGVMHVTAIVQRTATDSNGLDIRLFRNDVEVWSQHLQPSDLSWHGYDFDINVTAGDNLSFGLDPLGTAGEQANDLVRFSVPPPVDWVTVADSTNNWSSSGGASNGWSYKFATDPTSAYSAMTWDSSGYWKCSEWGGLPAIYQTHSTTQGGGTIIGFRQWHNTYYSGPMHVTSVVQRSATDSNGLDIKLFRNNTQAWSQHLQPSDVSWHGYDFNIYVSPGDDLSFGLDPLGTAGEQAADLVRFSVPVGSSALVTRADSNADWSSSGGANNGWSYKYATHPTACFGDMTWDSSGHWKCAEWGGEPSIYRDHIVTQCEGNVGYRQWYNASYSGTMHVAAIVDRWFTGDNGLTVRLFRNNTEVWSRYLQPSDVAWHRYDFDVTVSAGDHLSFGVDPLGIDGVQVYDQVIFSTP